MYVQAFFLEVAQNGIDKGASVKFWLINWIFYNQKL
jgi:hypothetical protein